MSSAYSKIQVILTHALQKKTWNVGLNVMYFISSHKIGKKWLNRIAININTNI